MALTCPSCGAENIEGVDECANCKADLRAADLPQPTSKLEQSVMQKPLAALQFSKVHAITPDTTIETAIHALNRQKIDILEVVEDGKLIGILTDRDIIMRVGADYASKMHWPVRQLMTTKPETLPPDAPIIFAINRMDVGGYRHVPVVQEGRMLGVVSVRDVVHYIMQHRSSSVVTAGKTTSHGVRP